MRYVLDRGARVLRGGRVLVGGSPGRVLRMTSAGAELLSRLTAGDDLGGTRGVDALLERLVDAGVAHPVPDPAHAPYGHADVTVVVPVKDRPDGLARLLSSLRADSPEAAVVVVDDGSRTPVTATDATVVRHEVGLGPAAARNTGARHASTPLIAFADSDCEVSRGWLSTLLAHLSDPRVAACAPRVRAAPAPGVLARYEVHGSPLDLGDRPARVAPGTRLSYVPSAALLVRAADLERLGGFDEEMRLGEDVDLVWRLVASGRVVRYEPSATVQHEVRPTTAAWLRQRFGYGSSAAALDRRHRGAVAPVVLSPWSAAVWGLVLARRPRLAAALAGGTVIAMARRVPDLPRVEVARLVLGGHLGAGRQLATAAVRVWWPLVLLAAVRSQRARRVGAASALVVVAQAWRRRGRGVGDELGPAAFAALTLADHLAYGAGVWAGCVRHRALGALLPRGPRSDR